ncbi:hypothetical protein LZC95_47215 [Pendulispora brunnea]|uniref:Uncharacterized protein n=1 Tax=Pendulispora brunnea TaxID=2905690 RepID=A0ABZ2K8Z6_9BACT
MVRPLSCSAVAVTMLTLVGCDAEAPAGTETANVAQASFRTDDVVRESLAGDVAHYSFVLRLGNTPNARIRVHRLVRERRPWHPRRTEGAVMLVHGDFSSFASNFAPTADSGMALHLAAHEGLDVWGIDRRWSLAPQGANVADFADMGLAQEIDDLGRGLAFARGVRLATGGEGERFTLAGFSHGAHLAYAYASAEAAQPEARRHVKALAPLDIYAEIAPDENPVFRERACGDAAFYRQELADGHFEQSNGLFIQLGSLAQNAPNEQTPFQDFFPGYTNRGALVRFAAQTAVVFPPMFTPVYHLASGVLDANGVATAFRDSPEVAVAAYFANASPYQSTRELADFDTLLCNQGPPPVDVPLDRIRIPLYYLGVAGGFGNHGLYSTTRVRSKDVTTVVLHRFGPEREAEDIGHADILFARDAADIAWKPLAAWIRRH